METRTIYLPTLRKLKIQNFTLYPNGLNFEYDFINGVNLIIGGNGMGKTTLVNIIKYAIIGNYSKQFSYSRTYQEKKIEGRKSFPVDYFKNRLDTSISTTSKATVTIEFEINNNIFIIERCLEELKINSLIINNNLIEGEIITQKKYDSLKESEKPAYLNYQFENNISSLSGMPFDDLIFFTNYILFFGENHNTVLWNDDDPNVQDELFNKYFNSPDLDSQRQEANRTAKYYDSVSRHKSEDIRAIREVLRRINDRIGDNTGQDNLDTEESLKFRILDLKKSIDTIDINLENKQKERLKLDDKIRLLNNRSNALSITETDLDKQKKSTEDKLFANKWLKLHKKYDDYLQNLKANKFCPMCNNEVDDAFVLEKISHSNNCFLCSQEINQTTNDELNADFIELDSRVKSVYTEIQAIIKDVRENENALKNLDKEFKSLEYEKRKMMTELRNLEYENVKDPTKNSDELQAFYDEIEELEKAKLEYQEKSKVEKAKADKLNKDSENSISRKTIHFSNLFSQFAGSFLGIECSLSYTDTGTGNKRFYPVIGGKIRYHEEELSESQRFFVDHSFRMSILTFFYTKPSFYIVETPDSSLDITYERNAAEVFAKFLGNPNSLIITSNLNNSAFVNHLIEVSNVKLISLVDLGKKSLIQGSNNLLNDMLEAIHNKIKLKSLNNES